MHKEELIAKCELKANRVAAEIYSDLVHGGYSGDDAYYELKALLTAAHVNFCTNMCCCLSGEQKIKPL